MLYTSLKVVGAVLAINGFFAIWWSMTAHAMKKRLGKL